MLLILNVYNPPFGLPASDWFAIHNDIAFASYYSEGDKWLLQRMTESSNQLLIIVAPLLRSRHLTLSASFNCVSSWS